MVVVGVYVQQLVGNDQVDVKVLMVQLEILKVNYVQEVWWLCELDMQVQVMQVCLIGKIVLVVVVGVVVFLLLFVGILVVLVGGEGYVSSVEEVWQVKQELWCSVDDVKQQQVVLFSCCFILENSFIYVCYDCKQFSFNGFFVLDVIFFGNIVIENVEFDMLIYNLVVCWGVSLCLILNMDVFYLV